MIKKYPRFNILFQRNTIIAILGIIILGISSIGGYFYFQYQTLKNNPGKAATEESRLILNDLNKLLELPAGEEPSIATIVDKTKLSKEPFFQKAENGDKLILYSKSGLAIIYRPSVQKIISVSPITFNTKEVSKDQNTDQLSLMIYNGGTKPGQAEVMKKKVAQDFPEVNINTDNSQLKIYDQNQLIILNKDVDQEVVKKISGLTKATISTLPEDEEKPDTDLLLIVADSK